MSFLDKFRRQASHKAKSSEQKPVESPFEPTPAPALAPAATPRRSTFHAPSRSAVNFTCKPEKRQSLAQDIHFPSAVPTRAFSEFAQLPQSPISAALSKCDESFECERPIQPTPLMPWAQIHLPSHFQEIPPLPDENEQRNLRASMPILSQGIYQSPSHHDPSPEHYSPSGSSPLQVISCPETTRIHYQPIPISTLPAASSASTSPSDASSASTPLNSSVTQRWRLSSHMPPSSVDTDHYAMIPPPTLLSNH